MAGDDTAPWSYSALVRKLIPLCGTTWKALVSPGALGPGHTFVLICILNAWEGTTGSIETRAFGVRQTCVVFILPLASCVTWASFLILVSSVKWDWCGIFGAIMHIQFLAQCRVHRKCLVSVNQYQKTFLEWKSEANEPWPWVRAKDTWCTWGGDGQWRETPDSMASSVPLLTRAADLKTSLFISWQIQGKQSQRS